MQNAKCEMQNQGRGERESGLRGGSRTEQNGVWQGDPHPPLKRSPFPRGEGRPSKLGGERDRRGRHKYVGRGAPACAPVGETNTKRAGMAGRRAVSPTGSGGRPHPPLRGPPSPGEKARAGQARLGVAGGLIRRFAVPLPPRGRLITAVYLSTSARSNLILTVKSLGK